MPWSDASVSLGYSAENTTYLSTFLISSLVPRPRFYRALFRLLLLQQPGHAMENEPVICHLQYFNILVVLSNRTPFHIIALDG